MDGCTKWLSRVCVCDVPTTTTTTTTLQQQQVDCACISNDGSTVTTKGDIRGTPSLTMVHGGRRVARATSAPSFTTPGDLSRIYLPVHRPHSRFNDNHRTTATTNNSNYNSPPTPRAAPRYLDNSSNNTVEPFRPSASSRNSSSSSSPNQLVLVAIIIATPTARWCGQNTLVLIPRYTPPFHGSMDGVCRLSSSSLFGRLLRRHTRRIQQQQQQQQQ
jgi:hypothetical protein